MTTSPPVISTSTMLGLPSAKIMTSGSSNDRPGSASADYASVLHTAPAFYSSFSFGLNSLQERHNGASFSPNLHQQHQNLLHHPQLSTHNQYQLDSDALRSVAQTPHHCIQPSTPIHAGYMETARQAHLSQLIEQNTSPGPPLHTGLKSESSPVHINGCTSIGQLEFLHPSDLPSDERIDFSLFPATPGHMLASQFHQPQHLEYDHHLQLRRPLLPHSHHSREQPNHHPNSHPLEQCGQNELQQSDPRHIQLPTETLFPARDVSMANGGPGVSQAREEQLSGGTTTIPSVWTACPSVSSASSSSSSSSSLASVCSTSSASLLVDTFPVAMPGAYSAADTRVSLYDSATPLEEALSPNSCLKTLAYYQERASGTLESQETKEITTFRQMQTPNLAPSFLLSSASSSSSSSSSSSLASSTHSSSSSSSTTSTSSSLSAHSVYSLPEVHMPVTTSLSSGPIRPATGQDSPCAGVVDNASLIASSGFQERLAEFDLGLKPVNSTSSSAISSPVRDENQGQDSHAFSILSRSISQSITRDLMEDLKKKAAAEAAATEEEEEEEEEEGGDDEEEGTEGRRKLVRDRNHRGSLEGSLCQEKCMSFQGPSICTSVDDAPGNCLARGARSGRRISQASVTMTAGQISRVSKARQPRTTSVLTEVAINGACKLDDVLFVDRLEMAANDTSKLPTVATSIVEKCSTRMSSTGSIDRPASGYSEEDSNGSQPRSILEGKPVFSYPTGPESNFSSVLNLEQRHKEVKRPDKVGRVVASMPSGFVSYPFSYAVDKVYLQQAGSISRDDEEGEEEEEEDEEEEEEEEEEDEEE
ncbi:unnamed protein product, partial [Protopolystoma xenopodis]